MEQMGLAPWESASISWSEPVRIVTWNVNGIRAIAKKGFFQFMEKFKPTVLCLQETKAYKEQCEPELHDNEKYACFWSSAKRPGYSGVAIYTKLRPLDVANGMGIEKFDSEGRVIMAKYSEFTVLSIYFPNGGASDERHKYKMEFLKKILPWFKELEKQGHRLIICGDYNIAHRAIDIFDPVGLAKESGFLPEERNWMDQLEKEGFIDCFRHFHPEQKDAYTWWSYFKGDRFANRGWRIDYICISKSLLPHLKASAIHPEVLGSDHCPVSADFEF